MAWMNNNGNRNYQKHQKKIYIKYFVQLHTTNSNISTLVRSFHGRSVLYELCQKRILFFKTCVLKLTFWMAVTIMDQLFQNYPLGFLGALFIDCLKNKVTLIQKNGRGFPTVVIIIINMRYCQKNKPCWQSLLELNW